MKKQMIKLNLKAIAKMLAGIFLFIVSILMVVIGGEGVQKEDAIITAFFFGVFCLCVIIKQSYVLVNGSKQVKKYLEEGNYTENQLELEYANSNHKNNNSRVRIGDIHLFISVYNGVYVIPISAVQDLSVRSTGYFDRKIRRAFYALYITPTIWHKDIKVLFMTQNGAKDMFNAIASRINKEELSA